MSRSRNRFEIAEVQVGDFFARKRHTSRFLVVLVALGSGCQEPSHPGSSPAPADRLATCLSRVSGYRLIGEPVATNLGGPLNLALLAGREYRTYVLRPASEVSPQRADPPRRVTVYIYTEVPGMPDDEGELLQPLAVHLQRSGVPERVARVSIGGRRVARVTDPLHMFPVTYHLFRSGASLIIAATGLEAGSAEERGVLSHLGGCFDASP